MNKDLEWYRCEDNLPADENRLYITWSKDDRVAIGYYTSKTLDKKKHWIIMNEINENVIAWAYFKYFDEI